MCLTLSHCISVPIKSSKHTFSTHNTSLMMSIRVSALLCAPSKTSIASTPRRTGQRSLSKYIQKPETVRHHPTVAVTHQHTRPWCQTLLELPCIATSRDHRSGLLKCTTGKATLTSTIGLQTALSKLPLVNLKRE